MWTIRQADWQYWGLSALSYTSDRGPSSLSTILVTHTQSTIPVHRDRDSCQGKWEQRNYPLPRTYIAGVSSKHSKSLTVPPDFQTLRHRKRLKVQFKQISHFYPLDFPCFFLQWEGCNLHPHVFNFHGKKYRCRQLGADPMPTQACRWKDSITFAKY